MIFITFDPYTDNLGHFVNNSENMCIICLEKNDRFTDLQSQQDFIKTCDCNCSIHYTCLKEYYNFNKICRCPICRECVMLPKTTTTNELYEYGINIVYFLTTYVIFGLYVIAGIHSLNSIYSDKLS